MKDRAAYGWHPTEISVSQNKSDALRLLGVLCGWLARTLRCTVSGTDNYFDHSHISCAIKYNLNKITWIGVAAVSRTNSGGRTGSITLTAHGEKAARFEGQSISSWSDRCAGDGATHDAFAGLVEKEADAILMSGEWCNFSVVPSQGLSVHGCVTQIYPGEEAEVRRAA